MYQTSKVLFTFSLQGHPWFFLIVHLHRPFELLLFKVNLFLSPFPAAIERDIIQSRSWILDSSSRSLLIVTCPRYLWHSFDEESNRDRGKGLWHRIERKSGLCDSLTHSVWAEGWVDIVEWLSEGHREGRWIVRRRVTRSSIRKELWRH